MTYNVMELIDEHKHREVAWTRSPRGGDSEVRAVIETSLHWGKETNK
jgi:hypothetical protein